ncbi:hypothetical protein [Haladaptatus sp. NG-SE-30]
MTDVSSDADVSTHISRDTTPWERLAETDPISIRDPLAELLGMIPESEPLAVTFADVAKAAGHACPAVAGAYRSTQLALEELYPDSIPVRSDIEVVVGGAPDDPGYGPMANVVRVITGAADETGFGGFGGYGGRNGLLSFGDVPGSGRSFAFTRRDTGDTVRVSFDPKETGVEPPGGADDAVNLIPKLVSGAATEDEREAFYDVWHGRVQRILDATPGPDSPFTLSTDDEP